MTIPLAQYVSSRVLVVCVETYDNHNEVCSAYLIPRPFPPPVFDHLQYANTAGEFNVNALEIWSHAVNQVDRG